MRRSTVKVMHQDPPRDLANAIERARSLLTDADRALLEAKPLPEAIWTLHLTLGHRLRDALGLWSDDALDLFKDISQRMPDHLALDADAASSALIAALWQELNCEAP